MMYDRKPWKQWPMPREEAVDEVLRHLFEEYKKYVANTPKGDLHIFHNTLGLTIRNQLGLWKWLADYKKNHPDRRPLGRLGVGAVEGGSDGIIEALWERLQKIGTYKDILRDPSSGEELPEEWRNLDWTELREARQKRDQQALEK